MMLMLEDALQKKYVVALLISCIIASAYFPSQGYAKDFQTTIHPVTFIDWPTPHERLEYKSCGCADSCWVAKLWDQSTKKRRLKLQLRCDCKTVFLKLAGQKEELQYENSCQKYETMDKFTIIPEEIRKILLESAKD